MKKERLYLKGKKKSFVVKTYMTLRDSNTGSIAHSKSVLNITPSYQLIVLFAECSIKL